MFVAGLTDDLPVKLAECLTIMAMTPTTNTGLNAAHFQTSDSLQENCNPEIVGVSLKKEVVLLLSSSSLLQLVWHRHRYGIHVFTYLLDLDFASFIASSL